MKRTLLTLALVLVVITASASQQPKPQHWEYKFDYKCHEKMANDLAVQGWELVSVDSFTYENVTGQMCVFKRPKS